jgi:hypothetical protein
MLQTLGSSNFVCVGQQLYVVFHVPFHIFCIYFICLRRIRCFNPFIYSPSVFFVGLHGIGAFDSFGFISFQVLFFFVGNISDGNQSISADRVKRNRNEKKHL